MDKISYKEFMIEAAPYQLPQSGEWAMRVNIWRDRGSHKNGKPFYAMNTFKTKEEAIPHCLAIGRQIIDGTIKYWNIDDL